MRIFFLTVLFIILIPIISKGQYAVQTTYYNAGVSYTSIFTDVDSNTVSYSEWFDGSVLDGQTVYVNAYYINSASVTDTLQQIAIEGNAYVGGTTYSSVLIDAIDTISQAAGVGGNATGYTNIIYSRLSGSGTLQHITMTPSAYYPSWRIRVRGGSNNAILVINVYARVADYVPTAQHFGNVSP